LTFDLGNMQSYNQKKEHMTECHRCKSDRIAEFSAKCSDLGWTKIGDSEMDGYIPHDMGVGGGDYLEITVCLDCGQLQGTWPLPETKLERKSKKKSRSLADAWKPDPRYQSYVDDLLEFSVQNYNSGMMTILPRLFGDDDDPDRVICGIIALRRNASTFVVAETLIDVLSEWEHEEKMNEALAKIWPSVFGEEDDE